MFEELDFARFFLGQSRTVEVEVEDFYFLNRCAVCVFEVQPPHGKAEPWLTLSSSM